MVDQPPSASVGRILTKTPWEIATIVANKELSYGQMIERLEGGAVVVMLRQAIFEAVRRAVVENSEPPQTPAGK